MYIEANIGRASVGNSLENKTQVLLDWEENWTVMESVEPQDREVNKDTKIRVLVSWKILGWLLE